MRPRDAARLLRHHQTNAEARLWAALRAHRLDGLHFRRQRPVGTFIADFYCHQARLVVEVDGGVHLARDQRAYDRERDAIMALFGVRVLRVTNDEVLNDLPAVLTRICVLCDEMPELPRHNVPAVKRPRRRR